MNLKKLLILFWSVFSILAVSVLFLVRRCKPDDKVRDSIIYRYDTVYVDSPTLVYERVVEKPAIVDTAEIIDKFFKQKVYVDTIQANEYVTVVISDTISLNNLDSQELHVYTRIPVLMERKNSFSFRFESGFNCCNIGAEYRHKKFGVFAGYDFVNKTPVVGLNYRLLLW